VPTILFLPQQDKVGMLMDLGGPYLSSPKVDLIFWGPGWQTDSTGGPTMAQISQATASILAGPYLSLVTQYHTDGHASLGKVVVDSSDPLPMTFPMTFIQQTDIQNVVLAELQRGVLDPNTVSTPPIYMVITPPGMAQGSFHSFLPTGDPPVFYGFVPDNDQLPTPGQLDYITRLLSHEIAEAMTDPIFFVSPDGQFTGSGITRIVTQALGSVTNEIADGEPDNPPLSLYTYRLNGILTQALWSEQDQAFAVYDGNSQQFVLTPQYDNAGKCLGYLLAVNGDQQPASSNDTITLDQTDAGGVRVTLNGEVAQFDPDTILGITVSAGAGTNTVTLGGTAAPPITIDGGPGTTTLRGPDVPSTWALSATNTGTLQSPQGFDVHFSSAANLTGGRAGNTFKFLHSPLGNVNGGLTGVLDGGGGVNTLDYSSLTQGVAVNLATGKATNVKGGIHHITVVLGGRGNNVLTGGNQPTILIGGSGHDVLTGGVGRSLLIGGPGTDTLQGGAGDAILIGGYTAYNRPGQAVNLPALEAILGEWARPESYSVRLAHLEHGGGLNGSFVLNASTVFDDLAADELIGGSGLDWFFRGRSDKVTGWRFPEVITAVG
jgi:Ca2+-binding RTX toxin-like protein